MKDWDYIWYRLFPKKGDIKQIQADVEQLSKNLIEFLRSRQLNEPQINFNDWENSINRMTQYSRETVRARIILFFTHAASIYRIYNLNWFIKMKSNSYVCNKKGIETRGS